MVEKLLFVDDEPLILQGIRRSLAKFPYQIVTADSGEEGLALIDRENFAVVASDHKMPGMTGIDFLSRVREKSPDTVRVLLSGQSDLQVIIDGINHGEIYRYIAKPWNQEDLVRQIEESVLFHRFLSRSSREKLSDATPGFSKTERLAGSVEMAGAVCHELNQPMQIISGYADMMMDSPEVSEEIKRYLEQIMSQVKKMADITKKLMRINRYVTREYSGNTRIIDIDRASIFEQKIDS